MDQRLATVRELLSDYLSDLKEQAGDSRDRYLSFVISGNRGREWKNKNPLVYRVRKEGNALMLEWYRTVWKSEKDAKKKPEHRYIRKRTKPRGEGVTYGYDLDSLIRLAPDWAHERTVEVESEAKSLRRQAHYCASMLVILGRFERFLDEIESSLDAGGAS
jgi:hypothetical protein